MAEIRQATIKVRDRQVSGGSIPGDAVFGEPFVNLYNGVLRFSGVTGGDFESSTQTGVFEVGSSLYNQKITNRLNINDNFIISGGTGLISTYGGTSGAGILGKFLSGTTSGFVLGNISDIQGVTTRVQPGTNITTGGTDNFPTVNLVASPSVNNLTFSGAAIGGNVQAAAGTFTSLSAGTLSGGTILSGGTNLYNIFQKIGDVDGVENVNAGTNITTGGTATSPIINVVNSPVFTGLVSATGFTDSSLTAGRVTYAGVGGRLTDEALFEYDSGANLLKTQNIQIGNPGDTGTTTTIYGDLLVMGQGISGFTSELYIEDNLIELNYNPTASTISTSLGAGWSIQDGSGVGGTDVFFDIRGAATGVANRSFATNLQDIRIRETGTISAPNGVYVIASGDIIDGGSY